MPTPPDTPVDAVADQLRRGVALFKQLRHVDTATAAHRAVTAGGLSEDDLRAIVLAQVYAFRQQADDPDTFGRWGSS